MIQIILLIAGVVYAFRKPKLKALTVSQFPGVSSEVFAEWQALELDSINLFLWATWGLLLISIPVALFAPGFPGGAMGLQILFFVLFVVLLFVSAIHGSKAAKLKKQHGIKWP
jgi:hypothetical protein